MIRERKLSCPVAILHGYAEPRSSWLDDNVQCVPPAKAHPKPLQSFGFNSPCRWLCPGLSSCRNALQKCHIMKSSKLTQLSNSAGPACASLSGSGFDESFFVSIRDPFLFPPIRSLRAAMLCCTWKLHRNGRQNLGSWFGRQLIAPWITKLQVHLIKGDIQVHETLSQAPATGRLTDHASRFLSNHEGCAEIKEKHKVPTKKSVGVCWCKLSGCFWMSNQIRPGDGMAFIDDPFYQTILSLVKREFSWSFHAGSWASCRAHEGAHTNSWCCLKRPMSHDVVSSFRSES